MTNAIGYNTLAKNHQQLILSLLGKKVIKANGS
jgi:hypothetical protein